MPETFRISKVNKFVNEKVKLMEHQQRTIEQAKRQGLPQEVISIMEINNNVMYNYTFDLCREFELEMPIVLGVTPK